jgi:hypothetical protein
MKITKPIDRLLITSIDTRNMWIDPTNAWIVTQDHNYLIRAQLELNGITPAQLGTPIEALIDLYPPLHPDQGTSKLIITSTISMLFLL